MSGKTFELVTVRHNWGDERVYYQDETGALHSLPLAWTSLAAEDPFVSLSAGRSAFRVVDLLELARRVAFLIREIEEGSDEDSPADR